MSGKYVTPTVKTKAVVTSANNLTPASPFIREYLYYGLYLGLDHFRFLFSSIDFVVFQRQQLWATQATAPTLPVCLSVPSASTTSYLRSSNAKVDI